MKALRNSPQVRKDLLNTCVHKPLQEAALNPDVLSECFFNRHIPHNSPDKRVLFRPVQPVYSSAHIERMKIYRNVVSHNART